MHSVHSPSLQSWLDDWDIRGGKATETALDLFKAAPGGVRTTQAFSTENEWASLDVDQADGCIRSVEHAYTKDGGLAILKGNIAEDGCVVKTAGVPEEIWNFTGTAIVFESQDDAVAGILSKQVQAGHVVVIRYEGPKGGPGMQEMLYRRRTSRGSASARSARSSPTAGSPAVRRVCRSATSRPRRPVAARSR